MAETFLVGNFLLGPFDELVAFGDELVKTRIRSTENSVGFEWFAGWSNNRFGKASVWQRRSAHYLAFADE